MSLRTPKVYYSIVATVLIVSVAVWGLTRQGATGGLSASVSLPEELSVASIKSQISENRGQLWQTMRDREDLTDEQRQQARRNMREVFQSFMNEHIDQYLAAAPEEKNELLDRHIDEMQERMKEWRQRREQREREREQAGEENRREDWRERMRERRGSGTTEQRKTRSESRSPDDIARRMAYFQAIRSRMSERGIEMPGRRGGGWGGRRGGG